MSSRLPVRLLGGPFDGQQVDVEPARRLLTLEWEDETVERDWDGVEVYATRVGVASYRRADERTFVYWRTQAGIGDSDIDLTEKEDLP